MQQAARREPMLPAISRDQQTFRVNAARIDEDW